MEIENKYASKGIAGTALGIGVGSLGLQLLNGGLGNVLGGGWGVNGNCGCSENSLVNRYELGLQQEIASKDARIGLLESNIYTDQKLNDLRNYVDAKAAAINDKLTEQAVYNATNTATIGCMAQQIAALNGLTKLVIPNTSVCPGWGNVTITPAAAPAAG